MYHSHQFALDRLKASMLADKLTIDYLKIRIDEALDKRDEAAFIRLTDELKELSK